MAFGAQSCARKIQGSHAGERNPNSLWEPSSQSYADDRDDKERDEAARDSGDDRLFRLYSDPRRQSVRGQNPEADDEKEN